MVVIVDTKLGLVSYSGSIHQILPLESGILSEQFLRQSTVVVHRSGRWTCGMFVCHCLVPVVGNGYVFKRYLLLSLLSCSIYVDFMVKIQKEGYQLKNLDLIPVEVYCVILLRYRLQVNELRGRQWLPTITVHVLTRIYHVNNLYKLSIHIKHC